MLSEPKTKGGFDFFTPKGIISPEKEKLEHTYQKEDNLHNGLEKEATVLGVSPSHYKGNTGQNMVNVSRLQIYSGSGRIVQFFSVWLQANWDMKWGFMGRLYLPQAFLYTN